MLSNVQLAVMFSHDYSRLKQKAGFHQAHELVQKVTPISFTKHRDSF